MNILSVKYCEQCYIFAFYKSLYIRISHKCASDRDLLKLLYDHSEIYVFIYFYHVSS